MWETIGRYRRRSPGSRVVYASVARTTTGEQACRQRTRPGRERSRGRRCAPRSHAAALAGEREAAYEATGVDARAVGRVRAAEDARDPHLFLISSGHGPRRGSYPRARRPASEPSLAELWTRRGDPDEPPLSQPHAIPSGDDGADQSTPSIKARSARTTPSAPWLHRRVPRRRCRPRRTRRCGPTRRSRRSRPP